jgi:hypothetical protein
MYIILAQPPFVFQQLVSTVSFDCDFDFSNLVPLLADFFGNAETE